MAKSKVHSTARDGAVSIRDKTGRLYQSRPIGVEVPLARMAWVVRINRLYSHHEHDFAPLFEGSHVQVCACGAVLSQEEVY
jgi:hypothetical protein